MAVPCILQLCRNTWVDQGLAGEGVSLIALVLFAYRTNEAASFLSSAP